MNANMHEESINFIKVNTSDSDSDSDSTTVTNSSQPSPHRRNNVAIIITLTLFTVIIGSILAASTRVEKPATQDTSSIKASRSIKVVCSVTQNPQSCVSEITAINAGNFYDPEVIFNLTLTLSLTELVNITSVPKALISKSSDLRSGAALRDCVSLFDDAASLVSKCVEAMEIVGSYHRMLNQEKVEDMKTWISAAMTDQETCLDGLEEMGYVDVEEVRGAVKRSSEYMSNSLAILSNMEMILNQFGQHLH